jgi:hypothetical protein
VGNVGSPREIELWNGDTKLLVKLCEILAPFPFQPYFMTLDSIALVSVVTTLKDLFLYFYNSI